MSSEFELNEVYRRIEHLLKFSRRAVRAAVIGGLVCALIYLVRFGTPPEDLGNTWVPSDVFLLCVGCYFFGVATSLFFIRKLELIVASSKKTYEQTTAE